MRLHHRNRRFEPEGFIASKGQKEKGKNGAMGNGPTRKGQPRAVRASQF
jgi:hypothetical protein